MLAVPAHLVADLLLSVLETHRLMLKLPAQVLVILRPIKFWSAVESEGLMLALPARVISVVDTSSELKLPQILSDMKKSGCVAGLSRILATVYVSTCKRTGQIHESMRQFMDQVAGVSLGSAAAANVLGLGGLL